MENQLEIICPICKSSVAAGAFFCPNCGKQLKNKAQSATVSKQFVVYFVSLFFPPFGLWYAWKYYREGDAKSIKIAIAAVLLTFISVIIMFWITNNFIDAVNQSINQLNGLNL